MDTQRLILLFIFGFSVLMLWDAWEKEHRPKPAATTVAPAATPSPAAPPGAAALPPPATAAKPAEASGPGASGPATTKGETIVVRTDLVVAELDTLGATLKRIELLKHKDAKDVTQNLVLLGPEHQYEAESGVTGEGGPNHRTLWSVEPGARTLGAGANALDVSFSARGKDGLVVVKHYRFKRDSYEIEVSLELKNAGSAPLSPATYFQLTHNG
jgi:YidC/Oxa1 family membrane protein insertase